MRRVLFIGIGALAVLAGCGGGDAASGEGGSGGGRAGATGRGGATGLAGAPGHGGTTGQAGTGGTSGGAPAGAGGRGGAGGTAGGAAGQGGSGLVGTGGAGGKAGSAGGTGGAGAGRGGAGGGAGAGAAGGAGSGGAAGASGAGGTGAAGGSAGGRGGGTAGSAGGTAAGTGGAAAGTGGATAGTGGATAGTGGATAGTGGASAGTGGAAAGAGGASAGTGGAAAGAGGASAGAGGAAGAGTGGGPAAAASVLQHHNNLARDGVYVDPKLTKAAAATIHIDNTFAGAAVTGSGSRNVYAQPLYLAGSGGKPDQVIVATEQNIVYAFNAASGAKVWSASVGTPVTSGLPCGNVNPLGVSGTPVIDGTTRTIYLDAMTADNAATAKHMVHALDADTGAARAGWPIDVNATASSGGTAFNSEVQNQRAALTLVGGKLFVPYGGHVGDCQGYHGWVVGITTSGTPQVTAWATRAIAGGVWGASGIASDGTSLFFATGNSKSSASAGPNTTPSTWGDGETVYKFPTSLVAPSMSSPANLFVPGNWMNLDTADQDIGGTNPVLFSVPGATPAELVMALGKDGKAYLLNRASLGGMDAQPLASITVAGGAIINAAVAYRTPTATYVAFRNGNRPTGCPSGQTGGITAIKISAASPPALSIAWCGAPGSVGSPSVSMTDAGGSNAIVWAVGGDNKLYAIDGDTGQDIGSSDAMSTVAAIETPIVTGGRLFVAATTQVYALKP